MADYTLPDLPYDYAALEPHISARIMELHHDKHHAAYVTGANKVQQQLADARATYDYDAINQLQKNLAFHLSGHVLHSLFWKNMSPDGGGAPEGELGSAIAEYFGDFDACKAQLSAAAENVQGSGWGAMSWDPVGQALIIEQVYDHQGNVGQGGPLCAAFPDGIPKRVLRNGLDHRQTIDGDHGLRWTPEDGAEFPEDAFLPEFLGRGGKP